MPSPSSSPPEQPDPRRDELLNAALMAYIDTLPSQQRLHAHLADLGLMDQATSIETALSVAVRYTQDYLWSQERGVRWSEDFKEELFAHVRSGSPWLSGPAFERLVVLGHWFCWHEGLNAQPREN